MIYKPIFLFLLLGLVACKKHELSPLEQLPPATQTGANTFGCLVNGKAWTPYKDCFLCSPALKFYYTSDAGGQFAVQAENSNIKQQINIGIDTCNAPKRYNYYASPKHPIRLAFGDFISGFCYLSTRSDALVSAEGFIDITRFDLSNGIFSGTFEFTLSKEGCETIKITNGRFDAKL
jgi:hypothetical protein